MLTPSALRFPAAIFATLIGGAALAQTPDPIGPLTKTQTFDRAQKINVGRTQSGKTVCYFREEGSSHSLDIGVSSEGAYMRLETYDERATTPAPPLRVFAGKEITRRQGGNEYVTGEFTVLQAYAGAFDYYVPNPKQEGFAVIAKGDAKAFLDMVARANNEIVVVQSAAAPKVANYVAIYHFKPAAIAPLLACAKEKVK
ncbi:MAG: hypothetical protein Q8M24_22980 [Pseudolabrys sp.]|nr:hypothetical protein [Pseudolabrys sp.]MDP2298317.1 hypothetical protein [Pseudolabrys sp.]